MLDKNKITVVGSGYVGMSLAVLLAQRNDVMVLDIDPLRVDKIKKGWKEIFDFYNLDVSIRGISGLSNFVFNSKNHQNISSEQAYCAQSIIFLIKILVIST